MSIVLIDGIPTDVGNGADEIIKLRAENEQLNNEVERLKQVPMKYRRLAFNAQLQEENARLREELTSLTLYKNLAEQYGLSVFEDIAASPSARQTFVISNAGNNRTPLVGGPG